ncbi:hypothetical protein J1N35_034843 [Gossypium stocksii]|uniref:Ferrochelatase n=1 Tax=Gossypium stocksii TaxID=47602 RepID=A0A9D3UST0_9ROSI|nr:hypothetical protein J1N35_034843 [Gossypium stocksii]
MKAASLSGVLSYSKLSGSSLCYFDDRFSRRIASFSRHSSNGFNGVNKPSSKALIEGPFLSDGLIQRRNWDIIRLPGLFKLLQRPLAKLISVLRALKSKEGYAAIGGGSPLRKITDEQGAMLCFGETGKCIYSLKNLLQANALLTALEAKNVNIKLDRIKKLVVLPLYPQFSISTTGSSIRVLQHIFREDVCLSRLPVSVILSWYQGQGYICSMADLIKEELERFAKPEESRVGPVQWLKPYTGEVLAELGQKGVKSLLAVPISFVSEHIETLEEMDMEYKHLALESGIENWGRVPALGYASSFITDLADVVVEALPSAKALSA